MTKLEIIGPYTPEHEGPFCTRELTREFSKHGKFAINDHAFDLMNAREVPVARELEVVGMRTRDMRSIATSVWHYSGDIENDALTYEMQFLVLRSDALAKLAEKDAEIVRYHEALIEAKTFHEEQDKSLSKQPPSSQGSWRRNLHQEQIEQIEAALKGPEA